MKITSNINDSDKSKQLIINNEKIYKSSYEPITIDLFIGFYKSVYNFLSTRDQELTEDLMRDKALLKLYNTSTKSGIDNFNKKELLKLDDRKKVLEEKTCMKSYFLFDNNPLLTNRSEENIIKENIAKLENCWKCGNHLINSKPGNYKCSKCGFMTYIEKINDKILVKDEAQYWNEDCNKMSIFLNMDNIENNFEGFGINMKEYYIEKKRLFDNNKKLTNIDFSLAIYNNLINLFIKSNSEYSRLEELYRSISYFCWENGLYFFELLHNQYLCSLLDLREKGCNKVRIKVSCKCNSCKIFHNKVIEIDVAINEMPIPNRNCENHHGYIDYENLDELVANGAVLGLCEALYTDAQFDFEL